MPFWLKCFLAGLGSASMVFMGVPDTVTLATIGALPFKTFGACVGAFCFGAYGPDRTFARWSKKKNAGSDAGEDEGTTPGT